ncbi:hypothetical protein ACR79N_08000 [Sphingobacterium siyangense]|uniref:hypothetical protein n=1 Tax=Sphingobacterium siyangense TaxID=459529 RepID=UPI003DA201D0
MSGKLDFWAKFSIVILMLGFLNINFFGLRILSLLTLPCIVFIIRRSSLLDANAFLLLLFSMSYDMITYNNSIDPQNSFIGIFFNSFTYACVYLVGKHLFSDLNSEIRQAKFLILLATCLAIIPIYSIIEQIFIFGFESGGRSMYLIWDRNEMLSATVIAGNLIYCTTFYSLVIGENRKGLNKKMIYLIIIVALLSTICCLRLGSRTLLVLSAGSILLTLFINFKKASSFITLIFIISVLSVVVAIFGEKINLFTFFQDRIGSDAAGIDSAGGRSQRWEQALNLMFTHPFGWEKDIIGFVHNFWLDIYRVSGFIPFILIMLFTFNSIKYLIFFFNRRRNINVIKFNVIINYLFVSFLLFFVEPIMDGFQLVLVFFVLLIGGLKGTLRNIFVLKNN